MDIEFKNGTMVVTHDSGHIDIYIMADLTKHRAAIQAELERLTNLLGQIDAQILEAESSVVKA